MKYDRLYGLSAGDYRYPGEDNAFAKIEKVPLLDKLADAYVRLIVELGALPDVEGNCFRVTEKTCARIYKLYELAAMRLDMPSLPPLYIKSSFEINAGSYGGSKPMIVLTSSSGRFQFSVENAYTVRYSTPISLQ